MTGAGPGTLSTWRLISFTTRKQYPLHFIFISVLTSFRVICRLKVSLSLSNKLYLIQLTFNSLEMRYVAAYLLAVLGGTKNPSKSDLEKILGSIGLEINDEQADMVSSYHNHYSCLTHYLLYFRLSQS